MAFQIAQQIALYCFSFFFFISHVNALVALGNKKSLINEHFF